MLDRERVLARLDELEGCVQDMEALAPADLAAYEKDLARRLACERLLQVAVEILLDTSELFVRGLRLGLPAAEGGLAARLAERGLLSPEDAQLLRRMQAFRNVLVHRYGALDHARVFANLRSAPGEFRRLAQAFRRALDAAAGR